MAQNMEREERRKKKHRRVRKKVFGWPEKPRLFVNKTRRHVYAQLIDDFTQRTITGVSTLTPEIKTDFDRGNCKAAHAVGKLIAEKALDSGINEVVFDRGGFQYHGRVAAVAEGAREGGLEL